MYVYVCVVGGVCVGVCVCSVFPSSSRKKLAIKPGLSNSSLQDTIKVILPDSAVLFPDVGTKLPTEQGVHTPPFLHYHHDSPWHRSVHLPVKLAGGKEEWMGALLAGVPGYPC